MTGPLPIIIPRILLLTSSVILPLRFTGMEKCPAVFLCRFPESITYAMREVTASALHGFTGTDRRFEYKGTIGGVTIVDDYAHHPTEIAATLHAAANYPHKTLWCVFQPHTYTRTKAFMKDFAKALSLADKVVLGISSETLQTEIRALGHECYYFPSFDEIENFLLENCINGDLLITMGAGDVVKIGENLLGK